MAKDSKIVAKGTVLEYSVNTYVSKKDGLEKSYPYVLVRIADKVYRLGVDKTLGSLSQYVDQEVVFDFAFVTYGQNLEPRVVVTGVDSE